MALLCRYCVIVCQLILLETGGRKNHNPSKPSTINRILARPRPVPLPFPAGGVDAVDAPLPRLPSRRTLDAAASEDSNRYARHSDGYFGSLRAAAASSPAPPRLRLPSFRSTRSARHRVPSSRWNEALGRCSMRSALSLSHL